MHSNTILATLVGMRFNDVRADEVLDEQFLFLVPEPDNPYDENAVRVLSGKGKNLGHISRSTLHHLPSLPPGGKRFHLEFGVKLSEHAINIGLLDPNLLK